MAYDTGSGANLLGRLTSVTDASGIVEYSYDTDGRLESELRTLNGIEYETQYGYDDAGNLRSMVYPTGQSVEYQPDPADPARIGAVVLNGTQTLASNLAYKPFGPLSSMTLGNGIQTTRSYDKNYQIKAITAGSVMSRIYTPDNVGNIEAITDTLDGSRSQSFGYDDLYRLTSAAGVYGSIGYTYDRVGNRKSETQGTQSDSYAYYPGTNRLQTITGAHAELFQYDDDGNTIQRIPGAANPSPPMAAPAEFLYNSSGQRSQKEAGTAVIYHYDPAGQLIAETDASGTLRSAYIWLLGQPLAMLDAAGAVYYFHNDHLGTPQKMTDAGRTVVWAADYLPFGQANVTVATVENNLRFAGQYYDGETGLHYNYWRYYDPKLGRYLRADPSHLNQPRGSKISYVIPLISNQPQELNAFSYVQNNPLKFIDFFGLYSYGTTDCSYYDRQCSKYGCDYYCNWAPKWCRFFNKLDGLQWTHCVRKCLQDYDLEHCSPKDSNCPDCSGVKSCNTGGHFFCYTVCGSIHYDSGIKN